MISSKILTSPEIRRFSKHILLKEIGLEGQEKFKQAKVAVIGAGGIGTAVLQYLASSGVGTLGIIDYALVDETNIQHQTLYGGNDLGKLKSIVSKQHLQNLFPIVNFEIINLQLTADNIARIIQPFGLIVDATNNDVSHHIISEICEKLQLSWVFGAVSNFKGEVSVIHSRDNLQFKNFLTKRISPISHDKDKGASPLSYGLVGNFMALEVLKLLLNQQESLAGQLLTIDMFTYRFLVESIDNLS